MSDLRSVVFENLSNGLDNEPDIINWSASDIVYDLLAYASDLEEKPYSELLTHVEEWLRIKKGT